ncbi:MAG: iron-sulfur cluster biosynthesis family protein [Thermonemataceae bacterium]|nr:iron-sulfur cluster biosynthesis family protein [Thermonemataceae bacterium]
MEEIPLKISDLAISEIKNIIDKKSIPDNYALRIGVKGGGCGATFMLGFDTPKITDESYLINNIPILIDKKHLMYVIGMEIDFEETQEGVGFTFSKK